MANYKQGRLLAVLAHPDDESFGPGGTLALYASLGVSVHLVCATRGELGQSPPKLQGHLSLADLREAELNCAASHLGLAQVHLLGYHDSGMPGSDREDQSNALSQAPLPEVVEKVTQIMRQIRPQVVITFDPIGGYYHPDHVAIHHATLQSFRAAGDADYVKDGLPPYQPQKLYYHTFPRRYMRTLVGILRLIGRDPERWGRNEDINLLEIATHDFPLHAFIDIRPVAKAKQRAAACHASQGLPPMRGVVGWLFRLAGSRETFMRALPPAPPKLREVDLFQGVQLDEVPSGIITSLQQSKAKGG